MAFLYRRSPRAGYTNICQRGQDRADPALGDVMDCVTFPGPFPPSEAEGRGGLCAINPFWLQGRGCVCVAALSWGWAAPSRLPQLAEISFG